MSQYAGDYQKYMSAGGSVGRLARMRAGAQAHSARRHGAGAGGRLDMGPMIVITMNKLS